MITDVLQDERRSDGSAVDRNQVIDQVQNCSDLVESMRMLMEEINDSVGAVNALFAGPFELVARPGRSGTLKDHIRVALRNGGCVMGTGDLTQSVLRQGYHSTSKRLTKQIVDAIAEMADVRRVGRGRYRLVVSCPVTAGLLSGRAGY
jgi:hypothetical protein